MIGISVSDVFSVIDFLTKKKDEFEVKSGLFSPEGELIDGDVSIVVNKLSTENDSIWFYKINTLVDYEFVYSAVIPSLYVDYGEIRGKNNPDANIFRFVANPMSHFTKGGLPNVKSKFMVVAYRPKDLLRIKESK